VLLGDADRERAVRQLRQAYEQGRLTHEELGTRAARALAARTRTDLWWALEGVAPLVDVSRFVNAARTGFHAVVLLGCWFFATGVIVFALMLDAVFGHPSTIDALIFLGAWLLVTWLLWRAWGTRTRR
jgi:hypothetical protein